MSASAFSSQYHLILAHHWAMSNYYKISKYCHFCTFAEGKSHLCNTDLNSLSVKVLKEVPKSLLAHYFIRMNSGPAKFLRKPFQKGPIYPQYLWKKWQKFSSCLLFLFSSLHLEILSQRPSPYLLIDFLFFWSPLPKGYSSLSFASLQHHSQITTFPMVHFLYHTTWLYWEDGVLAFVTRSNERINSLRQLKGKTQSNQQI